MNTLNGNTPTWVSRPGVLIILFLAFVFSGFPAPAKAQSVACSGGFTVYFEDVALNTGIGFDDVTLGQTRQDTVCAVFDYLANSVIVLGGAAPDILVAASENDGTGPLATGAAFYPGGSSPGFIGGTLLDHITTGSDPTPGAGNYDGRIQVDFGNRIIGSSTVTINSDHTISSSGQLDLFSIILHEIMHAFGVASFYDANGGSSVGMANSLFDQYLQDGNGAFLSTLGGGISGALTNGAVEYVGPGNSQSLAIYSPFFYDPGSSLSHLDDMRDLYPYVMRHSTSGGDDRVLSMAEIDILCDLGYTLYGTVCTNRYPLGVDDDDLLVNFTTPGAQVCINVLNNDSDPDGDPISIDPASVQILSGGGSLTINGNQICYTPSPNFVGTAVIIYQPSDGTRTGNTTRVEVDVQGTFCPNDPTNYICNGGFETPVLAPPLNFNTMICGSSVVNNWCSAAGTSDYFIRGGVSNNSQSFGIPSNFFSSHAPGGEVNTWDFPNPANNRYIGMYYLNSGTSEGAQTKLVTTLSTSAQYVADLYAYTTRYGSSHPNVDGTLKVYLDTAAVSNNGPPSSNAQLLGTFTIPKDQWTHIQIPVFSVASNSLEHLIILSDPPSTPSIASYIYIDDVAIREVNDINLVMQKTVDDLTPQLGQTINYTIQLCNQDGTPVSSATIEETMPAGLTYVSGMNNYPQHTFTNIPGNSCQSITVTATVDNTAPVNTPLTNCVGLTAAGNGSQSFAPDIRCVDITVPATDIMVAKTISNPNPGPGDTVTFSINVANLGPADANGIVINDLLPQGLNYSSHTISGTAGTYDQMTGNLDIPILASETLLTLEMVVFINPNACGDIENSASLESMQETDLNTTNNNSTVMISLPACGGSSGYDLSITKTPVTDCFAGGTCAYEIVITNIGTDPFSGPVHIVDEWNPGTVTFQTVSYPWTCNSTPPSVTAFCDNPSVTLAAGGGTTSFIIMMEVPDNLAGQAMKNCVNINWFEMADIDGDSNPENDVMCAEVGINICLPGNNDFLDVAIEKTSQGTGGFDDLIIGASSASPNNFGSGASFVVFGKADGTPVQLSDVTVGTGGFVINGDLNSLHSGWYVSDAGDVNGDGLKDVIVGSNRANANSTVPSSSFVVFGKADGTPVEVSDIRLGIGGFVIRGAINLHEPWSVSGAGDVNGDGLNDLIVGSDHNAPTGSRSGASFIVFGKTNGLAVELADVNAGIGGFAINGASSNDQSGWWVGGDGADVNGDGLDDLIVGAPGVGHNGTNSGASYVVFGKGNGTAVELSDVEAGIGGFAIMGISTNHSTGFSVGGTGDVNGDGLDDVIVGAPGDDPNGNFSGGSFVVFGKTGGTTVDLLDIKAGIGGFAIHGVSAVDQSGHSASGAGDVNGDGLEDLIVGAFQDDPNGAGSGASFVVFGKTSGTAVELSDVEAGNGGFVINGVSANNQSGNSVSDAGDVNGDGLDDIIIGAHLASPTSLLSPGASYVVFGKASGTPVELSDIEAGNGGFVIIGAANYHHSGWSVSGAGNVNGDSGGGQWLAGVSGTFTLEVTNLGTSAVPSGALTVSDELPQDFIINAVSGGSDWNCSFSNGSPATVSCDYIGPQLSTSQQFPLILVTATPRNSGDYINCAEVSLGSTTDVDISNNKSCIPFVVN